MSTSRNGDLHLLVGKLEGTLAQMETIHKECKRRQQEQIKELQNNIDKIKEIIDDHKQKDGKHFKTLYIGLGVVFIIILVFAQNDIVIEILKKVLF